MRTTTATIRLVMKRNRTNSSGEHPIYLVICFHGRVEKSTTVSVSNRYWDGRRECVKMGCPNAPVLNKILGDIRKRVEDKKLEFEYAGVRYTPQMLIECLDSADARDITLRGVSSRIIRERRLAYGTARSYDYTCSKVCSYMGRNGVLVDELTLGVVKDFARTMERSGIKSNTIKRMLCCIASCWNWCISRRLVDSGGYPFSSFKYTSVYRDVHRDYYLEESHIVRLRDYWLDLVIERNGGGMWSYREGAYDRLRNRCSPEFGIMWFLLCYKLGGAAPIDVALLVNNSFSRVYVDGRDCWKLEFKRKKTGIPVVYMVRRDTFSVIAIEHFLGSSAHFVYPTLNWYDGCEDKYLLEQSHKVSQKAIRSVREAFTVINGDIARERVESHSEEPTVDVGRVVMYTARHSRASNYYNSPGASVGSLASMLGRSANTIAVYAHQLRSLGEIAEIDDDCVI